MSAVLKIECINDNWGLPPEYLIWAKLLNGGKPLPKSHWVAEITGLDSKYIYQRRFLPYKKDYRYANSLGTRGVYAYYILEEGKIFEVKAPISWNRIDRYFCTVKNAEIIRLTEEEVCECLKGRLG